MATAYNRIQSRMRQAQGVNLNWVLTPTQWRAVASQAVIVGFGGPMGPGKSYAFACAMAFHAERNRQLVGIDVLHAYVLRDTLENLKKSPIPTIQKAYGPLFETFNQSKEGYIYTNPLIHLEFIGLADGGDLSKLQGPEVGLIWLEECCPIADLPRYNAGISEEVFNIALVRCTRQDNILPRLQCSTNPGDQDHWFYRRLVEPPDGADPETPLITKEYFAIDPYGTEHLDWLVTEKVTGDVLWDVDEETGARSLRYASGPQDTRAVRDPATEVIRQVNLDMTYLRAISRQGAMFSWKDDEAMKTRMVYGRWAAVYRGKRVAEAFTDRHVATEVLRPLSGYPAFRWYDSWGQPRCVLGQQFPSGQCRIYKVIRDHTDIRALCEKVKIELQHPRWASISIPEWRDIGDATMTRHDQSDKSQSAAKVVEDFFQTTFEPGLARWETGLKLAINTAFRASTSSGEPCVLINPEERALIAAFRGRWAYPTDASGHVKPGSQPIKSEDSHEADAVANGVSRMQPWEPYRPRRGQSQQQRAKQQQRARSYALPKVSYA